MLRAAGHAHCGHEDAERPVQRSTVNDVLRAAGRPLDGAVRSEMESRLGADFSDVRIHTDAAAKASAAEVGARAYTSGHHVVIGDGGADKHTLAHELTHVIQQRRGPVAGTDNGAGLRVSDPSDRFEREAEANATRVMRGPAPARGEGTEHRADTQTAARTGETVQRYTDVEVDGQKLRVSENGLFLTYPETPYVWVRDDAPANSIAPALRRADNEATQWNGGTYFKHWLGSDVQQDCLHAAEEIINNRVGELAWGEAEYSTIETTNRRSGPTEVFGQADPTNRRQARQYAGAKNEMADPQAGEAFVIVVTKPDPTKEMSQFHAGAVVARDGNDCVVLEAWSDGNSPPNLAAADSEIYTVGDLQRSFHASYGGPGAYFGKVGTTTVVIRPHPDVVRAP
ncbi:DUF4157 domain-containing protein [Streptomyces sp. 130]|nr:DUF4157 domain-containing protein [Streptomyces sp. 130]